MAFEAKTRTKSYYKSISEFYHQKYDDLSREERAILAQMDNGSKLHWNINDFRSITSFANDGERISNTLSSLKEKHYIRKDKFGWRMA